MIEDRESTAGASSLMRWTLLPFQRFFAAESASGIVLLLMAIAAMIWANSPWAASYDGLWATDISIGAPRFGLSMSLHQWINDGLMVIFFFLVGLEIKREVLVGELASVRQAALPIAAAIGGMLAPATIYILINAGTPAARGWAIPMATDIAFALGALALLGKRVPLGLKVFLTALAIVDDLGAVLVIALFYTSELSWAALGAAAVILVVLVGFNRMDVRSPAAFGAVGILLWLALLHSGVHSTIAGVLLAMTIPARTRIDGPRFVARSRELLNEFERAGAAGRGILPNTAQQAAIESLESTTTDVQSPLRRLEHGLHPWVSFGIMPLFALANAGVQLGAGIGSALTHSLTYGVALGLLIGKPIGIMLFSWLAIRTGVAVAPVGAGWGRLFGVSLLGGIGFTMSLFIAGLAFGGTPDLDLAKIGVLSGSAVAGLAGFATLWLMRPVS